MRSWVLVLALLLAACTFDDGGPEVRAAEPAFTPGPLVVADDSTDAVWMWTDGIHVGDRVIEPDWSPIIGFARTPYGFVVSAQDPDDPDDPDAVIHGYLTGDGHVEPLPDGWADFAVSPDGTVLAWLDTSSTPARVMAADTETGVVVLETSEGLDVATDASSEAARTTADTHGLGFFGSTYVWRAGETETGHDFGSDRTVTGPFDLGALSAEAAERVDGFDRAPFLKVVDGYVSVVRSAHGSLQSGYPVNRYVADLGDYRRDGVLVVTQGDGSPDYRGAPPTLVECGLDSGECTIVRELTSSSAARVSGGDLTLR